MPEESCDTTGLAGLQQDIIDWHTANGGHNNNGNLGHAMRIFNEVVELCIAEGATMQNMADVLLAECSKAVRDGALGVEGTHVQKSEEVADIEILLTLYCYYAGINRRVAAYEKHHSANLSHQWETDNRGVLWRRRRGV